MTATIPFTPASPTRAQVGVGLVSYLIVVLMFATYQPLRFSIEDPERQARYASVFSIVAGAFVPLNFIAVRLAAQYVHPRVLTLEGGKLPPKMMVTFYVALIGMAGLSLQAGDYVEVMTDSPAGNWFGSEEFFSGFVVRFLG